MNARIEQCIELQSTSDRGGFDRLLRRCFAGLGGVSMLIAVSLVLLEPIVIRPLDPDAAYSPGVAALQILVVELSVLLHL